MQKILIIEDEDIVSEPLKTKLTHNGYEVLLAKDGQKGLQMVLTKKPDLTILDINLPKLDGLSVLSEIRASDWGKNARVVLLTNKDVDDKLLNTIVEKTPSYYFIKANTSLDELLAKIEDLLV